jgi:hypothetical protein
MATSTQLSLGCVLAETFYTLKRDFFDPYRPELHYMRGPGPKWREKHAATVPVKVARSRPRAGMRRVTDDVHAGAF